MATAATIAVGAIASRGARKAGQAAAGAQQAASQTAIEEQRRQFDIAQEQAEPFRLAELRSLQRGEPLAEQQTLAAQEALRQRQALTGLSGAEAQQQALAGLQESPGQQFIRQRQEKALLRNQAAIGGLGGGNVRTALQGQAAGFAQQDIQNQLARLQGFAPGAQLGTGTTQNLAQMGAQQAQRVGQLQMQGGQAQASGMLGAQQARGQFLGQLGGGLRGAAFAGQSPGVSPQQGFLAGFR